MGSPCAPAHLCPNLRLLLSLIDTVKVVLGDWRDTVAGI